jgi:anti-sigma regulatory factor (Ser/Thr protein kinase)
MSIVRTIEDQFAEVLAKAGVNNAGVKRIRGIVGGSLSGVTDAAQTASSSSCTPHVVFARDELVNAAEYLCNLSWAVTSRLRRMKINLIISADTLPLETERCWLLALVVQELVKNAVLHACFFGTQKGKISIELTWEGSFVHCAVSDNRPAMARARPVRGLRIAHNLARSLGGRIGHWFDDEGTSFVATFPFTERELQENRTSGSRPPARRIETATR